MITSSTLKHLRIPFSIFLLPVFLFAVANAKPLTIPNAIIAFIVLHLFIYPASNGFNSYFDKDEGSIGGLKNPPKVTKELYWVSLVFDALGILLAAFINVWFALMVLLYGLISKAYSHPSIRLKKYPIISWLTVGIFQGGFTYMAATSALFDTGFAIWQEPGVYIPALLSSLLLLGSYPMTQIYQHEEDRKRGDITISLIAGIRGTFILTACLFVIGLVGFYIYYKNDRIVQDFYALLVFMLPVFLYFNYWFVEVLKNKKAANFKHTMRFNALSSLCLIAYFSYLALY